MSNLKEVKKPDTAEGLHSVSVKKKSGKLAVLVLGMHRSGTSAVTGLISKLGVGLPDNLLAVQSDNERGFFESEDIVLAHERLFAEIGTSWSGLDDLDDVASTPAGRKFIAEMRELLERQFEQSPKIVLKDPRICRLTPLWLKLLDDMDVEVMCVHVTRHPLAVAASLATRNSFAPGRSILLWLDHQLRAERETRGRARMFVDFDQVLDDWRPMVERLALMIGAKRKLGVAARVEIETFLTQTLRHHEFEPSDILSDASLPEWVQKAYLKLEHATEVGSEPDAAALDEVWDDFDRARSLFNAAIADHLRESADLRGQLDGAKASGASLRDEYDALQAKYVESTDGLARSEGLVAHLQKVIDDERQALAQVRADLTASQGRESDLIATVEINKDEAEKAVLELHQAYAGLEGEFNQTRNNLQGAILQIEDLQKEAQLKQVEAQETQAHLEAATAEQAHVKAQLSEANDRTDALRADLALARRHAEEMKSHLAEANEQMSEANAQLATLRAETDSQSRLLQQTKLDLSTEREKNLHLRRQNDEGTSYGRYLESHVKALEKTVREIRSSTSWKITAPLRRMRGIRAPALRQESGATSSVAVLPEPAAPVRLAEPEATAQPAASARRNAPVDIIVPVYRGLETTRACIESVYACDPGVPYELIIIDDYSPEPAVSEYVASLAGRPHTVVLKNEQNKGFVGTVNRGMSLNPDHDIVLLNSDTEVANDWLRRLVDTAYSAPKVSSVTPFSNNATICSYPRYCDENMLPDGLSLAELDRIFAEANPGKSVDIPTAVGFCMFITRDSLNDVGLFDEEAFGKGYGEENDFCLRSAHAGWRHLLAADTFVFHKGGVSFAESAVKQQEKAAIIIRERWPSYFSDVAQHVSKDPERPFRLAATALRYKRDPRPVILAITHPYGGGVERQIDDLKTLCAPYALFLTLRPAENGMVRLESDALDGVRAEFDMTVERQELLNLLKDFGVTRVHIHHTMRYPDGLRELISSLGVPFDFTIHDYFTICPRAHLGGTESVYCGEPDDTACNACIKRDFPVYDNTIDHYRKAQAWIVRDAERVIAPSADTAQRFQRYFPERDVLTVPHSASRVLALDPKVPALSEDERLRILVLGVLAPHKGLSRVKEFISLADTGDVPVEIHLLGSVVGTLPESGRFIDHGSYVDSHLVELIEQVNPHLIWFPAQVPETFSFTLGAAKSTGRPIAAADLGALPERLSGRAWSWMLPWQQTAKEFLAFVQDVRKSAFLKNEAPPEPVCKLEAPVQSGFYQTEYLAPVQNKAPMIGRGARRRIVTVDNSVLPTACGQIRVVLPLTHPVLAGEFDLEVLPFEEALNAKADLLLLQRTAVPDPDLANRLADYCDRKSIRKLFEIDDDLFELPDSHPEKEIYADLLRGAEAFMKRADRVVVTTPVLAERMERFNPAVTVFPNYLDDRIWFTGPFGARRHREDGEALRVLFAGGSTHREDLDFILDGLKSAARKRPGKIEFHMIGSAPTEPGAMPIIQRRPPPDRAGQYVRFVEWLRRASTWHAAIAPLVPDRFNLAKSPLKFLDYGALGLAGIYSDQQPFSGVVKDGQTGVLAADPQSWADALVRMVDDEAARFAMATAARADVREHHTLLANADAVRALWRDLAG